MFAFGVLLVVESTNLFFRVCKLYKLPCYVVGCSAASAFQWDYAQYYVGISCNEITTVCCL